MKQYTAITGYGDYIKEPFTEEDLKDYVEKGYEITTEDTIYELVPRYKVAYSKTDSSVFELEEVKQQTIE